MKYCSNFRHDLEVGQVAEKEIGKLLSEKKIEIKKDMLAKKTGNVFVEYMSRGKTSGIDRSEADYYCFVVENLIIFIPTNDLKEIIKPLKGTKRDVRGGDNNTSRGVLLPLTTLIPTNE
tara:strand:+ start:11191 stop:11547 length:357 start_codon:yes stop_codon:yes gene_type:complete